MKNFWNKVQLKPSKLAKIRGFMKMSLKNSSKMAGFSLLEVALSIMIVGIAVACVVPIFQTIGIANSMRTNEEKFTRIRFAMQAYLLRYGHLPSAASSTDGISTANKTKGFVPYKTLGIEKKYLFDAKSQEFIYVVNKFLIQTYDANLQPNVKFLPITMPLTTVISPGEVTFCRYYQFEKSAKTGDQKFLEPKTYDQASHENGLNLMENGQNILDPEDVIFIMHPLYAFADLNSLKQWQKESLTKKEEKYKNTNIIAWILICKGNGKNGQISAAQEENRTSETTFHISSEDGIFNDLVFYQTRFDMAAQVGFPATIEPIYSNLADKSTNNFPQIPPQKSPIQKPILKIEKPTQPIPSDPAPNPETE